MKTGSQADARLAQVAELTDLRRRAEDDPEAKAELVRLCREGMLVPYWERGEARPRSIATNEAIGAGSRLKQIEERIARVLSPTERAQFERFRETLEREESTGSSRRRKAAV